jgi:hypothetical protein
MVAHTRAPAGPDRLRPLTVKPTDRTSVGEGESFERSTGPSSTSIHPPLEPRIRQKTEGRLRALNLPRTIHVEEAGDKPARVHTSAGPVEIESIRERWRIDDEWWRHPISRVYYHVLLVSGDQLTIFKDLETGQWFQQQY